MGGQWGAVQAGKDLLFHPPCLTLPVSPSHLTLPSRPPISPPISPSLSHPPISPPHLTLPVSPTLPLLSPALLVFLIISSLCPV